jgi:hypothetical protein
MSLTTIYLGYVSVVAVLAVFTFGLTRLAEATRKSGSRPRPNRSVTVKPRS